MATLAKIHFEYGTMFSPEQQKELHALCFNPDFIPADVEKKMWGNHIMFVEDAVRFGKFTVHEVFPEHMVKRMTVSSIADFEQRNTTVINERCNVSVGGLGLLLIDEVKVALDLCTEALQNELSSGWRILAICVQPDQRRPDYILGKSSNK